LFVADGGTEGETPNAFTQVVERADAERAAVEHEIQLAVRCRRRSRLKTRFG